MMFIYAVVGIVGYNPRFHAFAIFRKTNVDLFMPYLCLIIGVLWRGKNFPLCFFG